MPGPKCGLNDDNQIQRQDVTPSNLRDYAVMGKGIAKEYISASRTDANG
jgi:hypothetical protein